MKQKAVRILALVLLAVLLGACGAPGQSDAPTDPLTLAMTEKLQISDVADLPIAHKGMTKAELRQLCIDYFTLQVSFQWTPNANVRDYPNTYYQFEKPRHLIVGYVYGGIPYQSLGTGNLYRWLEYYDEKTGVFDIVRAKEENGGDAKTHVEKDADGKEVYYRYRWMRMLFNQCSVASFWGWGRVINSANFVWTSEMNACNGFIPVGYTYGYTYNGKYYGQETIQKFGVEDAGSNPLGYDTEDVIADWKQAHGSDAMYKCYAQMQPADCLVSGGHVMMVRQVNLYYNEDGSVNYRRSTVSVLEQIENWNMETTLNDGKIPYNIQGRSDKLYSFAMLQDKEYIPFTFAEFLEEDDPRLQAFQTSVADQYQVFADKIDVAAGTGVEKAEVYVSHAIGKQLAYSDLQQLTVGANYPISDVFVTVTNKKGETLLKNTYRADVASCREVAMSAETAARKTEGGKVLRLYDGLKPLADGSNTVTITMRLSTGQLLEVVKAKLTC